MKWLQLITGNANKVQEYRAFAESLGFPLEIKSQAIEIPERQSENVEDVLRSKLLYVRMRTSLPFIVEDTVFLTDRYPNYPGTYAKFVNSTLGIEGWKRLFTEGDRIMARTTIALAYLGTTQLFRGELEGVISFKHEGTIDPATPLNSLFFLPKEKLFLGEAVKQQTFENHRKKALKELVRFLKIQDSDATQEFDAMRQRWDDRAKDWAQTRSAPESFANYEHGYERFNTVLNRWLPTLQGRALDLGCGDGEVAKQLASNLGLDVTGIDLSTAMVAQAKALEKPNLRFRQGQIEGLEETYDVIASRGIVLSHQPAGTAIDFLQALTKRANPGCLLFLDFLQQADNGSFPAAHDLQAFSLHQLRRIMDELGWVLLANDGSDASRVRIAVFRRNGRQPLYFATSNPLKFTELQQAVGSINPPLAFLPTQLEEIQSSDVETIVRDKLKRAYAELKQPVICTDGGIFIEALHGFPGVNAKQAAETIGAEGILKLMADQSQRRTIRRNAVGFYDGYRFKTAVSEIACEISNDLRQVSAPCYPIDRILIPLSPSNPNRLAYSEMTIPERVPLTELPELAAFIRGLEMKGDRACLKTSSC